MAPRVGPRPRPAIERVMARVDKRPDGCWIFTGSLTSEGYGQVQVGSNYDGSRKPDKVHRIVYQSIVGPIPSDRVVHHRCHVRACCNPDHLELVDPSEHGREHGYEAARVRWGTT